MKRDRFWEHTMPSSLRRTRSPAEWQAIIDTWQASGKPVSTYCEEHELPQSSFYAWKQRLADHKPEFVDVTALAIAAPEIVIGLPNGVTITVKPGADQQSIAQVLRALGVGAS